MHDSWSQIVGAFAGLVCFACGHWGTVEEAERIFRVHEEKLNGIYGKITATKEIKEVTPALNLERDLEFIPKYGSFTADTEKAYLEISEELKEINLASVRIERFPGLNGGPIEDVSFVVFYRGVAGSAELIVVSHFRGDEPIENFISPDSRCKQIKSPDWYVCHLK